MSREREALKRLERAMRHAPGVTVAAAMGQQDPRSPWPTVDGRAVSDMPVGEVETLAAYLESEDDAAAPKDWTGDLP